MVYNTQNYCVCGLCPSFGFEVLENTTFRKLGLFLSSGEGKEMPALLGPLQKS
jgi:hypothetical protein